jgi:hypothetical protein
MGILDLCPHLKEIVKRHTHLEWAEIDEILVSLDKPWQSAIIYKVEKNDGSVVYGTEFDDANLYEKLLNHLIQCDMTDNETKKWAMGKKKEIDEKWNEFVNNR